MLRDALFVGRKDVQYMLRSRETILWVFVMPIVFFYFIGTITGGFGSGSTTTSKLALDAGGDAGFLLDRLTKRLEEQNYEVVRAESAEEMVEYSRRLVVPPAFTDSVLAGVPVKLRYEHGREETAGDYESMRVGRAVYTMLADVAATTSGGEMLTPAALDALDAVPRTFTLEVKSAGQRKRIPTGFEQAIPGIMVMFLLLVMTTSGAVILVLERNGGMLRRLASTPIQRLAIVLGKWGGKLTLGAVQILFAMLAGTLIFSMDWGPDLAMVVVVLLTYGAVMAALGVLLGSVVRTEGQAVAIGVISANSLAALGGCWWPIEITPAWMQKLQLFLPTGWAMDAMHRLISFQAGPASVLPHVLGMAAAAWLLTAVSVRVFRFE